MQDNYYAE